MSSTMGVTPVSWAESLLSALGAPVNATNIGTITGWERAEGGAGPQFGVPNNVTNYNPLNVAETTGPAGYGYDPGTGQDVAPGSSPTPGNNPPIASFTSWAQGLAATVDRLKEPFAAGIVSDLMQSAPTGTTASAVVASHWGTGLFSAGPTTGGGATTTPASGSTPASSSTTPAGASLTDIAPGGGLDPLNWPGDILGGASNATASALGAVLDPIVSVLENWGLIVLGVVAIIIGLVVLTHQTKTSAQEHGDEERARAEPDVDVERVEEKKPSGGAAKEAGEGAAVAAAAG